MNKTLAAIAVKNNHHELGNLLDSISKNKSLGKLQILVVDDSDTNINNERNIKVIQNFKKLNLQHINTHSWRVCKNVIKEVNGDNSCLKFINLGKHTFNTYSTLNVASIIAISRYPDIRKLMMLDGDIVFPQKFDFSKLTQNKLTGFKIMGSPDLSRTQWIHLYIRYLLKKYNRYQRLGTKSIVYHMILELTVNELSAILSKYTDLYIDKTYDEEIPDNISFPTRGIDTNAMIIPLNLLMKTPFPNWWGQKLSWFQRLLEWLKIC